MTSEEFYVILREYIRQMQLPSSMCRLSQFGKQSKDAAANRISQQAISATVGAESDNVRLERVLRAVVAYIDTEVADLSGDLTTIINNNFNDLQDQIDDIISGGTVPYKWGVGTVAFGGGTDEHNTCTITSDHAAANVEWVNADSIWFGTVAMATSSGPNYHFFQCSMGAFDPTPTAYFEIIVYCPTAPVAGNYDVCWVAFPNP